MKMGLEII